MISVQTENSDDWKRNLAGEIVTKDNINSYIPELKLGEENTNTILNEILAIDKAKGSWQEYFSVLERKGHGAIVDLIKNTDDLSKLTGDDLVKANQQARKSALAHNAALKQQTLGAKAASVAMQALATVGTMFLGMAISWGISKLLNLENEALSKSQKAYQDTLDEVNKVKEKEELVFSSTKELSELLKSEKWGADSAKAASQIYQNMADELERVGDVENSRIQQLRDEAKQIERNTKLSQEERDAKAEALRKEALTGWGEQKTVTTNEDLYNDAKDVFWKTVEDEFDGIKWVKQFIFQTN